MKVYQFANGLYNSLSDQVWMAVTEEGDIIARHVSSSRSWGRIDTGPTGFYKDKYPEDAEVIVCPAGEFPPEPIMLKAGFMPKDTHGV